MASRGEARAAQAARRHWRVSLAATCTVLLLSAAVSFVPPMLAYRRHPVWPDVTLAGTPWPYFIGAQGAVLAFVLLVTAYTIVMGRADRRYRAAMQAIAEGNDGPGEVHADGHGDSARDDHARGAIHRRRHPRLTTDKERDIDRGPEA
ncbi:DUF4212 domain-containing protein [Robbsia andropogonis]|uniref:DUF4212 domain-containing protein n=1 Tax=Robbsia andropogonis TaxID=28092 RepID=UPI000698AA13|nr:sodium/substrate symporter small subunit [Robbsia andropogonis]